MAKQRMITASMLGDELVFSTSRSSGPGGQHVNKTNTKVTVRLDIAHSAILTDEEKQRLMTKLASKLTSEGVLVLSSQDKRSQLQNKADVIAKMEKLLTKALARPKSRRATKPTKSSVQQRIEKKKRLGEKKKWRRKLD